MSRGMSDTRKARCHSDIAIGVVSYRALGHVPPRLTTINFFFRCTLICTKSDSDYYVDSCLL